MTLDPGAKDSKSSQSSPKSKGLFALAIARLKPYLRWVILGGTLFFVVHTLRLHWREVAAIRIDGQGWGYVAIALGITLLAHVWAGWVWGWILRELGYAALGTWSIFAYLKTNIAKYLPGNVWHFYGRVMAAKSMGVPLEGAALSVVMEPLLMAISALLVAFVSNQQINLGLQLVGLLLGLGLVHPRVLNPVLKKLAKAKSKVRPEPASDAAAESAVQEGEMAIATPAIPVRLKHYPLIPLLGELIFLGLRGAGFVWAIAALEPVSLAQVPSLLSAFSLAWMLGLVVPGAPGGIGVFEATALALLDGVVPSGVLLGGVALYRLISTLAEAIGAALAWGFERLGASQA
ncbi:MAG: lysylphosphatidylglycerol synthase domain-containing protein [Elainellaceae cyanobacterium]